MNKIRRKAITEIIEKIQDLQSEIDELLQEEQESFDNLPEGIQSSERGEKNGRSDIRFR